MNKENKKFSNITIHSGGSEYKIKKYSNTKIPDDVQKMIDDGLITEEDYYKEQKNQSFKDIKDKVAHKLGYTVGYTKGLLKGTSKSLGNDGKRRIIIDSSRVYKSVPQSYNDTRSYALKIPKLSPRQTRGALIAGGLATAGLGAGYGYKLGKNRARAERGLEYRNKDLSKTPSNVASLLAGRYGRILTSPFDIPKDIGETIGHKVESKRLEKLGLGKGDRVKQMLSKLDPKTRAELLSQLNTTNGKYN